MDAGKRGMAAALSPALSKAGQRRRRCLFITASLVISWLIKVDLKQIYCSYSCTQKVQNGFL